MFLAEPARTPYDLHFHWFGVPVRVTPFFWLAALILGSGLVSGLSGPDVPPDMPQPVVLYAFWIAAVFISLLIHEMGHAIAFRRYGIEAYIVLYHFGGLAVPSGTGSFMSYNPRTLDSRAQIVVSAAGPAAQLLLAAIMILLIRVAGHSVPMPIIERFLPQNEGLTPIPNLSVLLVVYFLLWPSIYWAILNLVPVYPLDGGQIARELFLMFDYKDGMRKSLILSILASAALALYGFTSEAPFLGMMFVMLGFSSYQILQAYGGGGGFGGGSGGGRPW